MFLLIGKVYLFMISCSFLYKYDGFFLDFLCLNSFLIFIIDRIEIKEIYEFY